MENNRSGSIGQQPGPAAGELGPADNVVHLDFGRHRRPRIIDGPGWYHEEAIQEERAAKGLAPANMRLR